MEETRWCININILYNVRLWNISFSKFALPRAHSSLLCLFSLFYFFPSEWSTGLAASAIALTILMSSLASQDVATQSTGGSALPKRLPPWRNAGYIYIYIYICVYVYVCMCMCVSGGVINKILANANGPNMSGRTRLNNDGKQPSVYCI